MAYFSMTMLALKWAMRKPPTTRYPFVPMVPTHGARGRLTFVRGSCVFCTVCAKKCPTGALAVNRALKKWAIDRLRCICCGYCVEACPKKSLALAAAHVQPAITRDRETF